MSGAPESSPVALRGGAGQAVVYPVLFLLLWSSGFAVVKLGLAYAEPLTFLSLRYACVVAVLLVLVSVMRLPWPRSWSAWRDLCVVGALIQFGYFAGTYLSLAWGLSAGALAVIVSMQPLLVGVLSPALLGERVGRLQAVGLLLGFAGALIVILSKSRVEASSLLGLGAALAALMGISGGVMYERRRQPSQHPLMASLVQCGVGLLLTVPLALSWETQVLDWTPTLLGALAYLVIGNSLVAISLLLAMARHQRAARVSALFFMVPPLAALMACWLLGEVMPTLAWGGMLVAMVGVWLVSR
ncbi:DMT family transporter [Pseudomonas sp. 18175]|uniref:DMT family transporter n=1 Tax=Pseudomonas sp. 18175 TaxID=3390056 RepID=UPI003D1FC0CA